jgi:hypothetical protein
VRVPFFQRFEKREIRLFRKIFLLSHHLFVCCRIMETSRGVPDGAQGQQEKRATSTHNSKTG